MGIVEKVVQATKKHLPDILVGIGVVGVIGGTVIACKDTKKLDPVLEEHKEMMDVIHESAEKGEIKDQETGEIAPYTEQDKRRDTALTYFKTGWKVARIYLPSGAIISGSLACILGSHKILNRRNLGLTAAYTGIAETFKEYRNNIIEKFGEDADIEARYGLKAKKKKNKDGEEETTYVKTEKFALRETDHSRFFRRKTEKNDPLGSKWWDEDKTMRFSNIRSIIRFQNKRLEDSKSKCLPLNMVLDAFDLPPAKDGWVMGYKLPMAYPVDENGFPQVIDPEIYCLTKNGDSYVKKSVDEILDPDRRTLLLIDDEETLIDFSKNLELI